MDDTEMVKCFGIPVDDVDEQKDDKSKAISGGANGRCLSYEDMDEELMQEAAEDVDDAQVDELVTVYDKENPVTTVSESALNYVFIQKNYKNG